jgi:hypothetical protein
MMDLNAMMAQAKAAQRGAPGAGMGTGAAGLAALRGTGGMMAQLGAAMNMSNELQKSQSYTTVEQVMAAFERGEGAAAMRLLQFPDQVYLDGLPTICETLCRYDPRIAMPGKSVLGAALGSNGVSMVRVLL